MGNALTKYLTGKPKKKSKSLSRHRKVAREIKRGRPDKNGGKLQLLFDASGSMLSGNKLQQAREGGVGFAQDAHAKGYHIGVICFNSDVSLLRKPQKGIHGLKSLLKQVNAGGSTNMSAAIRLATSQFGDTQSVTKSICIITDGFPDHQQQTITAAQKAKKRGLHILAVGTDDADQEFLQKLTSRDNLASVVPQQRLKEGIQQMAGRLPSPQEK